MLCRSSILAKPSQKTRAYATQKEARVATFKPSVGTHPLTEVFANVPPHVEGALSKPATLKTGALPNGIRIATLATPHPVASVGIFVDSGSRYETSKNTGVSYFLQKFGVSETHGVNSELRLTRVLEGMNANYLSAAAREQIYFGGEVGAEVVDSFVPILFDVINPEFNEYEVIEKRATIEREVHNIEANPRQLIFEVLHQEAYRNKGLGQSLYPPIYNIDHINEHHLKKFHSQTFTPKRIVLVGTGGVDHEKLLKIAADLAGDVTGTEGVAKPPSPYVGGEARFAGDYETHVALGFQGAALNGQDLFALGVLQHALGGGRKLFKQGLSHPSSRLNRAVEKADYLEEANTFNFNYSDSGLFGVFGVAHNGHAADLVRDLTTSLSNVKNIDTKEVERARAQYKASILDSVDKRVSLLEFVGTQIIATGRVSTPSEFAASVDSVTVDAVRNVAKKVLSSKPTLVAMGDVDNLPTLDQIRSSLQ